MTTEAPHYSMLIQWSDEDQKYVVSFPEWRDAQYISHIAGSSYAEAAAAGADLLAFLIESAREEGEALPPAQTYDSAPAAP